MVNNYLTDELAQILWDYNNLNHKIKKSDCILVLGNFDIRTAQYGAKLFLEGYAPLMIFSGNKSDSNRNLWEIPEAQIFANEAIRLGVPKDKVFLEKKATNTGENILFTKKLIEEKGLNIESFIVVQKPFMLRRVYSTFLKQWPDKKIIVSAPKFSFEEYPNDVLSKEYLINIMVGDTQRIKLYPAKGFQIAQEMPEQVWNAVEELVNRGYTSHLIKE